MASLLRTALCALCACSLAGCRARAGAGASAGETAESPSQVTLYGVKLESYRGSALAGQGRAVKLVYQRSAGTYRADEALLQFPARSSSGEAAGPLTGLSSSALEVRAATLKGQASSPVVEGEGGVVARSAQGVVARTPRVRFDGQAMIATGREGLSVRGPSYGLDAGTFELRVADEEYLFDGAVSTQLGGAPK